MEISHPSTFKEARLAAALTQEQVAEYCGVTPQAVSQWEVGAASPGGPARRLFAQLFNLSLDTVDSWFIREAQTA